MDLKFLQLKSVKDKNEETYQKKIESKFNTKFFEISFESNKQESYQFGKSVLAFLLYRYTGEDNFGILGDENVTVFEFGNVQNISDLIEQTQKTAICHKKYDNAQILFKNNSAKTYDKKVVLIHTFIETTKTVHMEILFQEDVNADLVENFFDLYQKTYTDLSIDLLKSRNSNELIKVKNYNLQDTKWGRLNQSWNKTDHEFDMDSTLYNLFEQQVEKTPDNIAVLFEDVKLSYKELNDRANQLANYLRNNYEIKPDDLIALLLDRSEYMIIAILAVLKAGAAYVPISPEYPEQRIKFILENTKTQLLLMNDKYETKFMTNDTIYIDLISIDSAKLKDKLMNVSTHNPITTTKSTNLAYVIYTSGTTGNPKGVMIEHRSVVNYIRFTNEMYQLQENEIFSLLLNYVFDGSVVDIFLSMLNGHTLCISSTLIYLNGEDFSLFLDKYKITSINATPSMINNFKTFTPFNLRRIVFGGEKIENELCDSIMSKSNDIHIFNAYGPTETTVSSTAIESHNLNFTIGKPIKNTKCYVLDSYGNQVPVGAIGELHIGGVGVGRGYLYNDELTSKKFIPNPFQTEEEKSDLRFGPNGRNARIYKTGDLVRWLPSGDLDYIGRNDFQVKIRGMRVELGEIESVISAYSGIERSVVVYKKREEGIDGFIIGYYSSSCEINNDDLLNHVRNKLPEHMCPSVLVHLDTIPLNQNGKVDLKALPTPTFSRSTNFKEPRNDFEIKMRKIWSEVLKIDENEIGINDDFFSLGGSSFVAIKLVNNLNKRFKCKLQVHNIFSNRTIDSLVLILKSSGSNTNFISICNVEYDHDQVLSFSQQSMWFDQMISGSANIYTSPRIFKIRSDCCINIIEKCIQSIVCRHHVLRTKIKKSDEGELYQMVVGEPLKCNMISIRNMMELNDLIIEECKNSFDLENEFPIRVCFYILNKSEIFLNINIHHMAFDGWSADIFFREFNEFYDYFSNNETTELKVPKLDIQYKDFAFWQKKKYFEGEQYLNQLKYWKDKLNGYEILNLRTDKPFTNTTGLACATVHFDIDKNISKGLRDLAKRLKVSLYTVMLSCYSIMLRAYCDQDDLVIGTPSANRNYSEIENLIGYFVNTLVLRIKVDGNMKLSEYFESVGNEVNKSLENQDFPFQLLVKEIETSRDTLKHPIIQVMFLLQSFASDTNNVNTKTSKSVLEIYEQETNSITNNRFSLMTTINDVNEHLEGNFSFNIELFNESTIDLYIQAYKEILNQIVILSEKQGEQQLLSINDIKYPGFTTVINSWNKTDHEFDMDSTLYNLFEQQVEKTPDNIAVLFEDVKLSYKELNDRANQLANYLRNNYEIKPDDLIALLLDRSEYMIIAILAVLKAGAAYVPISPEYPEQRIKFILENTKTQLLLMNDKYETKFMTNDTIYIDLISIDSAKLKDKLMNVSTHNPITTTKSTNLAYVIYTSGTTGNPKGVMIEHRSVVNILRYFNTQYQKEKNEVILLLRNYVFDVSVQDIFQTLINGNTLIIPLNLYMNDTASFSSIISNLNITHFSATPSFINQYIDFSPAFLKSFSLIGEYFSTNLYNQITKNWTRKTMKEVKIFNDFGPTECTIASLSNQVNLYNMTIGKQIWNTTCYVLDSYGNQVPVGAIGELHIGGVGVGRGYLYNDELTSKKFIPNPFQTEEEKSDLRFGPNGRNARIYKTGDLVRWLPSGDLDYIGRNDFQVKIRGMRVELGEIESVISAYSGIERSVVVYKKREEGIDGFIIGYYSSSCEINNDDLLNHVRNKLPEHMCPSVLVHLDTIPLNQNGKVDLKALPTPTFSRSTNFKEPRNDFEIKMRKIWSEVLKIDENEIGINDDFFSLGGSSFVAIKLVNNLNKRFKCKLQVHNIFSNRTIDSLVLILKSSGSNTNFISICNVEYDHDQVLSFSQQSMWFDQMISGSANIYTSPRIFKIRSDCCINIIEKCIQSIVCRHHVLRTKIKKSDEGELYQMVVGEPLKCNMISIRNMMELNDLIIEECKNSFDLENEFPIRVCFYILNKSEIFLNINIHHMAFDGWSADIFFREFNEFYDYFSNNETTELKVPKLDIQYKDFAFWQKKKYFEGEQYLNQLKYWKDKLNGYEILNLRTDKPFTNTTGLACATVHFDIDKNISKGLRDLAKRLKVSLYTVMLSCYSIMLRAYCDQDDLVIGTPSANRNYSEIENLIGYFVNTLVLRIKVDGNMKLSEYFESVGNEVNKSLENQDFPFQLLVKEIETSRDTLKHPIIQVMFLLQSFASDTNNVNTKTSKSVLEIYEQETNSITNNRFSLMTTINDVNEHLEGNFSFNIELFNESTIDLYIQAYKEILNQIVILSEKQGEQQLLSINDIKYPGFTTVINSWNKTDHEFDMDSTLYNLFEQQVEKTPDNIAVLFEDVKLSYKELNDRANQLANYLRNNYEIKPDDLIALLLDRSEYMIIAILAVLKAGAAYVPISPEYPEQRIKFILENTKTQLLLMNDKYETKFMTNDTIYIDLISIDSAKLKDKLMNVSTHNPITTTKSTNLAYVIYTSGTTGNPKGVMIEHRSVVNYIRFTNEMYQLQENEIFSLLLNYVFDGSVVDIFLSMLNGHTLFISSTLIYLNGEDFSLFLDKYKITSINATPSMINNFKTFTPFNLRRIVFGGEKIENELCDSIMSKSNDIHIFNAYGPTETTVSSTAIESHNLNFTIGKPIKNTKCYVLDSYGNQVPVGAIGELHIGGVGVGRGYLYNDELTSKKFIPNPFQTEEEKSDLRFGPNGRNARIYKTGDLVRWLPSGDLDYIGRNDFQVKIRGMRVELGEIESVISAYSGIERSVVVYKKREEGIDGFIIGYYSSSCEINNDDLLNHVRNKLPEHMCPSVLVHLDTIPLNQNGKVDLKALPTPTFSRSTNFKEPRNDFEIKMRKIWSEVLKIDENEIGINDDFFSLGGSSFVAIKLVNNLNKRFKCKLQVFDIFSRRSIQLLLPLILEFRDSSYFLIKLNKPKNKKPILFMIHGGLSGCEVYINFAVKLSDEYECYGIDSYNLYNETKESNLNALAIRYLDLMNSVILNNSYNILGWSLGGQIALEIASILESKAVKDINIYALDTWILGDSILETESDERVLQKRFDIQFNAEDTQNLMRCIKAESDIQKQKVSSILKYTKITLFKAMLEDTDIKFNNMEKCIENMQLLQLVEMNVGHHDMILKSEDDICAYLKR